MEFEKIAKQLANPLGDFGIEVALGMNKLNECITKNTYKLLNIKNHDKVLEIGMGNGKFIPDIMNAANTVFYTGVDLSETMVTEAIKLNKSLVSSGHVDLIDASIEKMPFWSESFNKICSINTIYFWRNPEKALLEVDRVLTENGVFIISFRPFIEGQTLDFSKYGFKEYKMEDIESLLLNSNFKINTIKIKEEEPVSFNGKIHALKSVYYILQKKCHVFND